MSPSPFKMLPSIWLVLPAIWVVLSQIPPTKLPARSVTLDGEIVQVGERGIDFYAITGKQTRNVSLMAFDILWLDAKDLRSLPLQERLAQLEMLLLSVGKSSGICLVPSFDDGQP